MSSPEKRMAWRIGIITLCAILGVLAASSLPERYRRAVTLDFKNKSLLPPTEEKIFTQDVVFPVIDTLQLEKRWNAKNKTEVFLELKKSARIVPIRNTDLFSLAVEAQTPEEAAEIANALATSVQRKYILLAQEGVSKSLEKLSDEAIKLRDRMHECRAEMIKQGQALHVVDSDPETLHGNFPEAYSKAKINYLQSKRLLEAAERKLVTESIQTHLPEAPVVIWEKAEAEGPGAISRVPAMLLSALLGAAIGTVLSLILIRSK